MQKSKTQTKRQAILRKLLALLKMVYRVLMEKPIEVAAITNPKILLLENGQSVQLIAPVGAMQKPDKKVYLVPKDFVCDGASIPRALWWLCGAPLTGKYRDAAILHDAAYAGTLEVIEGESDIAKPANLSRLQADLLFMGAMKFRGCNPIRSRVKFWAVRIFGGSHYSPAPVKVPQNAQKSA